MNTHIKNTVFLIAAGCSLVIYAETRFATVGQVREVKQNQERFDDILINRLDRIEDKIDKLGK